MTRWSIHSRNQCVECGASAGHDLLCDDCRPLYGDEWPIALSMVHAEADRTKAANNPQAGKISQ